MISLGRAWRRNWTSYPWQGVPAEVNGAMLGSWRPLLFRGGITHDSKTVEAIDRKVLKDCRGTAAGIAVAQISSSIAGDG